MEKPRFIFNQAGYEAELAGIQAMSQKHIEPLEVDHTVQGSVFLFNIKETDKVVTLGGLGSFYVPACPKDKPYSRPCAVWKMFPEGRATEHMNKMRQAPLDGYLIAESLVGYGIGFAPEYGLRKEGVFAANAYATMEWKEDGRKRTETILRSQLNGFLKKRRGATQVQTREASQTAIKAFRKAFDDSWVEDPRCEGFVELKTDAQITEAILAGDLPTEQEIDEANDRLTKYAQELVTIANSFYAAGNQLEATQPPYLWAAKRTGNSGLPWAKGVVMMATCSWCQSPINPQAILCLACGNIAPGKEQAVIDARLPKFRHLWEHLEAGGKGKGKAKATAQDDE